MKKISLLLALCMLLTVGGVYAVWTYTDETTTEAYDQQIMELSGYSTTGAHGTYAVDATTLTMVIDPVDVTDPEKVHTTSLVMSGYITLTFTPNIAAPDNIKKNGPASSYKLQINTLGNPDWTFDDPSTVEVDPTDIVTLVDAGAVGHNHDVTWDRQGDGSFTCVIQAETLKDHINLTEFVLDTLSDYQNYNTALSQGKIEFVVFDKE